MSVHKTDAVPLSHEHNAIKKGAKSAIHIFYFYVHELRQRVCVV